MSVESKEVHFNKKFRESWRFAPENHVKPHPNGTDEAAPKEIRPKREVQIQQIEKLTSEKELNRKALTALLLDKEYEIQSLQEELETAYFTHNEIQEALAETQTIIEQQQDQLTEFRRLIALSRTDADALKLRSLFLKEGTKEDQLMQLQAACERLEAEVEALTWQLDQAKRTEQRAANERDFLQRQLQEYKDTEGVTVLASQTESAQRDVEELRTKVEQLQREKFELSEAQNQMMARQQELEEVRQRQEGKIALLASREFQSPTNSEADSTQPPLQQTDDEQVADMRRIQEERERWRSYASRLVRSMVENCEEFIKKTPFEEPEFHTDAERRWYDYAIQLLQLLVEVAPERMARMDLQLLKRSISSRRATVVEPNRTSWNPGQTDILSAVNIRQSRKKRKGKTEHAAQIASTPLLRRSHRT